MSKLTIFDLDNTLLAGDSDRAWGQYIVEKKIVSDDFLIESEKFYNSYYEGDLDIDGFLAFCLKPLTENKLSELLKLRKGFIEEKIKAVEERKKILTQTERELEKLATERDWEQVDKDTTK